MPQGQHSVLQGRLVTAINKVILHQKLGHAFPELRCTFGMRSLVPYLSIFTWGRSRNVTCFRHYNPVEMLSFVKKACRYTFLGLL
jgi:Uma2 family endonuclease